MITDKNGKLSWYYHTLLALYKIILNELKIAGEQLKKKK
jgi:hypothetical protein